MNKNTIQMAKKSTVLLLGLFMQINFAHSKLIPTSTDHKAACTGDNSNYSLDYNSYNRPGSPLNTCQTYDITAENEDTITVTVKTAFPNTKLVISARPRYPSNEAFVLTTNQYSKPGVYTFTFRVQNYTTNIKPMTSSITPSSKSYYNFYAIGEAEIIPTKTSPISVTISNITAINTFRKNIDLSSIKFPKMPS